MRIIYFLALATVVLSCTDSQDEMPSFEPQVQNELVITLQNFNDSIMSTKLVTRSKWLRFLAVATADISGGFELGKIGATLGSSFPGYGTVVGGAIGAAIGAAGSSYMADLATRTSISSMDIINSKASIQQAYCYVKENNLMEEYSTEAIGITLPPEYASSMEVGIAHNAILTIVASPPNDENEEIPQAFTAVENAVLSSEDYIENYETVLSKVINWDVDSPVYVSGSGTDSEIINLFIEVFHQYSEDINDVNFIVNKYIEKIEASDILNELQKKNIYDALTVAVFSFYHWSSLEETTESAYEEGINQ